MGERRDNGGRAQRARYTCIPLRDIVTLTLGVTMGTPYLAYKERVQ